MYQFDHILVCLDLTAMDDFLIRYSNFMVEKFKPQSIAFMHVMRTYDISQDILATFPDLDEPLVDILKDEMQEKVTELFEHKNEVETAVIVGEGVTTETIVQYSQEHNITLTLMGKKIGYQGRGSVVRKVLSLSPSSVLLISESTQPKIEHIMVRMDFSKITSMAMKMALHLQELTGAKISCHHVYKLPLKYFPQHTLENERKLEEHVERHSQKEYKKFARKMNIDPLEIPCTCSIDAENEEAHILYNQALNIYADMIMIGSKIKSELADVILDSTSEKLAGTEKNIPVLVVKDRKQTLGFLEALFD
ncbi:hypothetical protein DMA11_19000 [Marinilabiliaceae bacterium JC017]|nr:hypothetical protein DMA11_19000 [Marinilabiliaceae bacterium JC017]